MNRDLIHADNGAQQQLLYRHFAWLTALRFRLREKRSWKNTNKSYNVEYRTFYSVPEWESNLADELKNYLASDELTHILGKIGRYVVLIGGIFINGAMEMSSCCS